MASSEMEYQYFQVDYQDHQLPEAERKRRGRIKSTLEAQFQLWQNKEQQLWSQIPSINTRSFLGLNWSTIFPTVKHHFNFNEVSFELLSELKLSVARSSVISSHTRNRTPPELWLYKQYCQYAIHIQDFEVQYLIPLIEISVTATDGDLRFNKATQQAVGRMIPAPNSQVRVVLFPQTRYSFIEDEIFQSIYPMPSEQVRLMSHKLLPYFQSNNGYYNLFPPPFLSAFPFKPHYKSHTRFNPTSNHIYIALLYPVINLEFHKEYLKRKNSERIITLMQSQYHAAFPEISQSRYARAFDFTGESTLDDDREGDSDVKPERVQSARALFEYACGDFDTVKLDERQTSLGKGAVIMREIGRVEDMNKSLLVVDPLWIIAFPGESTICAYRNGNIADNFQETWGDSLASKAWGEIVIQMLNEADKCMGTYEPTYRKHLSSLQYRIHTIHKHDLIKPLIKDMSLFVAELTLLLEPLQSQIKIIKELYDTHENLHPSSSVAVSVNTETPKIIVKAIETRKFHLESLKSLLDRANELQTLLFQLSSIGTANLQSEIALQMANETQLQVNLAKENQSQNRSILVFTVITVVFLPLMFFTSYFGMNTTDVRAMKGDQKFFWSIAGPISLAIISGTYLIAFQGHLIAGISLRRNRREISDKGSEIEMGHS